MAFNAREQILLATGQSQRRHFAQRRHLEAALRTEARDLAIGSLFHARQPQPHGRGVVWCHADEIFVAVAVEIANHQRADRLTGTEFNGLAEFAAVLPASRAAFERPHRYFATNNRREIRSRIADQVRDDEPITARGQAFLGNAPLHFELPRLDLLQKHDGSWLTRVDNVEHSVAIEVEGHDGVHLMRDRHLDALEAPVGGNLVHAALGFDGIVGRRAGFLQVQLDAALEVVDHDQVEATVAVHVADGDWPCVGIDFHHLEAIEAKVGRDFRILAARRRCEHESKANRNLQQGDEGWRKETRGGGERLLDGLHARIRWEFGCAA